jgi:hypothetical protein
MKKRLHDKKAGIVILCVLFCLSLAETVVNLLLNSEFSKFNLGEPFAMMIFATIIFILTFKKNDRACYICYGAWVAWFVLEQIFEFPGMISTLCSTVGNIEALTAAGTAVNAIVSIGLRMATMLSIIVIGAILAEYMSDGTIHNRAFNVMCVITILLLLATIIVGLIVMSSSANMIVYILNNLSRIAMVFLFAFFAYDSAKAQLKKTNLTK